MDDIPIAPWWLAAVDVSRWDMDRVFESGFDLRKYTTEFYIFTVQ